MQECLVVSHMSASSITGIVWASMVRFRDGWPRTWKPVIYSASFEYGLHLHVDIPGLPCPLLESPGQHSWTNTVSGVIVCQPPDTCSSWQRPLGGLCWWHIVVQLSHRPWSRSAVTAGVRQPTSCRVYVCRRCGRIRHCNYHDFMSETIHGKVVLPLWYCHGN